ncbi:hypothetical protein J5N97_001919 [Dioscorea zingiberensis]|uniref:Tail specific protease domain-containing protein n=1 Tax=Dioscorea zingiberensis TaxID=325984 RepID=A0A9D5H215_9LILI|nr:hypothetical protein J5N97_001919 [Dioscorea zingiberensis]
MTAFSTPVAGAGCRKNWQGDEILAVNGVDVKGKSAFEVSSLIQGPNETFVTIKLVYVILKEIMIVAAMKRLSGHGAGIEIAKLFLNEGETVIYTVGKDPQYQQNIVADTAPLIKAPVIVKLHWCLFVAGCFPALHDNCKGVLVGDRTFRKGLIQSVFELQDGSGVVVTVGKYVTPNHKDINGNGIEPDIEISLVGVTSHNSFHSAARFLGDKC